MSKLILTLSLFLFLTKIFLFITSTFLLMPRFSRTMHQRDMLIANVIKKMNLTWLEHHGNGQRMNRGISPPISPDMSRSAVSFEFTFHKRSHLDDPGVQRIVCTGCFSRNRGSQSNKEGIRDSKGSLSCLLQNWTKNDIRYKTHSHHPSTNPTDSHCLFEHSLDNLTWTVG